MNIKLSVIIPAYNEALRIGPYLAKVVRYLDATFSRNYEILVVDDGSSDDTVSVAAQFIPREGILSLPENQGKGAAVRAGMLQARGELSLLTDADGSVPIEEERLLRSSITSGYHGAIGSRALLPPRYRPRNESSGEERRAVVRPYRHLVGRAYASLVSKLTGVSFKDTQCGFKMFRSDIAKHVFQESKIDGFGYDVEILYLCQKLNLRVEEIAVHWIHIPGSKVSVLRNSWSMYRELKLVPKLHPQVKPLPVDRKQKSG